MKYQVFVSGAPRSQTGSEMPRGEATRDGYRESGGDGSPRDRHRGVPAIRRFPPVLQFLTEVDPLVAHQLESRSLRLHRQGRQLQEICDDLYLFARSIGYDLVLGVQEVLGPQMPSFPGQTVHSALLMADLRRIAAPGGYHQGRMAG